MVVSVKEQRRLFAYVLKLQKVCTKFTLKGDEYSVKCELSNDVIFASVTVFYVDNTARTIQCTSCCSRYCLDHSLGHMRETLIEECRIHKWNPQFVNSIAEVQI